jgi:hypothetical protein
VFVRNIATMSALVVVGHGVAAFARSSRTSSDIGNSG